MSVNIFDDINDIRIAKLCQETKIKCQETKNMSIKKCRKSKINIIGEDDIQTFICNYCDRTFTQSGSLNRHLTQRCTVKKEELKKIDKDEEEKNELKKMILTLQEQVTKLNQVVSNLDKTNPSNLMNNNGTIDNSNNTNNNTNNNINNQVNYQLNGNITTNNIKIEFGKEDLSKISNDFFIKTLLNSSGALIPSKIIEGIHFNPEFKEFMNVFISDFSRNKAMIYDGKTWNIANADEIVNTLFDKAIIFCEDRNEELFDKIQKNEKIKKKINKEMHVMDIMNNNDPYEYNEYKEPVDVDGNVLSLSELKRGKSLNGKAKEHLKKSLYNKKTVVAK